MKAFWLVICAYVLGVLVEVMAHSGAPLWVTWPIGIGAGVFLGIRARQLDEALAP